MRSWLILACTAGLAILLAACGGSDAGGDGQTPNPLGPNSATPLSDDDSAPPQLDDIRSGGPSSDEDLLISLALTEEDLPEEFILDIQETTDFEHASVYLGHYINLQASFPGTEPFSSDVSVWLFGSIGTAIDFFREFESLEAVDFVESTQTGRHLPVGPEFERFDVVAVEARKLESPIQGDSLAVEIAESVKDAVTGVEFTSFNVGIYMRIDRVVAGVSYGTMDRPASIGSVTLLAERLQERLHAGLPALEINGDGLEDYVTRVELVLSRLIHETDRCSTDRSQPCLTTAFVVAYLDLGRLHPPDGFGLRVAHDELHGSMGDLRDMHKRSEVELPTEALLTDSLEATERFGDAVEGWAERAESVE